MNSATNSKLHAKGSVLLTGRDIRALFSVEECIPAVEEAFRLHSEGKSFKPQMIHVETADGQFHIKAGGLAFDDAASFCVKINSDFSLNLERYGLPSIQGVIVLSSGENGYPLAVMDSREITLTRTGAATAVAAKYLANTDSHTVTICGSGPQARIQLRALTRVLAIQKAFVFARDSSKAQAYAADMSAELDIPVTPSNSLGSALNDSDVCITCTRSTRPFVKKADVAPGTFISAIGADTPEKQELDSTLLKSNKVVVDVLHQCARVGELHHALDEGMTIDQVHAELGDVISGKKSGRSSPDEITIFDSTGTALQDVATAFAIYKKALLTESGVVFDFFQ
jgi:ornithine cyclodeaminase/alanine dehydrogenase